MGKRVYFLKRGKKGNVLPKVEARTACQQAHEENRFAHLFTPRQNPPDRDKCKQEKE